MDSGASEGTATRSDEAVQIAAALDDARITEHASTATVQGTRNGIALHVEWRRRSQISVWKVTSTGTWPRLLADVRRRAIGEGGAVASGAIAQLLTGDEAFDHAWLIEGAPRTRALLVFDEAVRRAIGAARDMSIHIEDGNVLAGVNGRHFNATDVLLGIDAVVAVRLRLDALAASSSATSSDDEAELAEIASLRATQDKLWARASVPARIGLVIGAALITVVLLSAVFYGCGIDTLFGK